MIEKCDCVLILENAKPVVVLNELAECTVFIKCSGLRAHDPSEENFARVCIRPAQKTEVLSTWGCQGSRTRGFCDLVRWHAPKHAYFSRRWLRSSGRQPSYPEGDPSRFRLRHNPPAMKD